MKVAIIPARGGSKRIPRKNIKLFSGLPMLAWSIQAAQKSGCFQRIIVSTDDEQIAAVATEYGAEVPFLRPDVLADDFVGTTPVIRHAVEWLQAQGEIPTQVCCIYATAPFIQPEDLQQGAEMLDTSSADYAFTVTTYAFPIQRAVRLTDSGRVNMLNPELFNVRSQDLEETWHDAGQFYWGRADAWLEQKPIFSEHSIALQIPRHRVQDIDTMEDWNRAQWLFRAMQS